MEQITLPAQIELIKEKAANTATLIMGPCHPGYGNTIGNALRRVLLSSLPGGAVTGVKIAGVNHEFAAIENVGEDIVQILLNLKQLRVKVFSAEPVRLTLNAKGEKEVTAADISPNADVEFANPDLRIATLTDKDAELSMEIMVEQGRGYIPVEERVEKDRELGYIMLDAVFTPVRAVGYRIENMRVGQKINYDKLLLTVETDGTIDPAEAVRQAAKLLIDHFALCADIESGVGKKGARKSKEDAVTEELASEGSAEAVDAENSDASSPEDTAQEAPAASEDIKE